MKKTVCFVCAFLFIHALKTSAEQPVVFPQEWHDLVSAVCPSFDGKWLAAGDIKGTIVLYDAESGRELRSYRHPGEEGITALAWSPGSAAAARLASAAENSIVLWEALSGAPVKTLETPFRKTFFLDFSPDGKKIAAAGEELLIIWDAARGTELCRAAVKGAAFAWDRNSQSILAACGPTESAWDSPAIRRINAANGRETGSVPWDPGTIKTAAFDRSGGKIAVIKEGERGFSLWDASRGQKIVDWAGQNSPLNVESAAFSPDGAYLATGADGRIFVWELSTGSLLVYLSRPYNYEWGGVFLSFIPGSGHLVSEGGNGYGLMRWEWNSYTGPEISGFSDTSSPDHYAAIKIRGSGNAVSQRVWDAEASRELRFFAGSNYGAIKVEFSPDGKKLAGYYANELVIWDIENGKQESTRLQTTENRLSLIAPQTVYSPGGTLAAVPAEEGYAIHRNKRVSEKEYYEKQYPGLTITDTTGGGFMDEIEEEPLYTVETKNAPVFSADSKYLTAEHSSGFTALWDAESGRELVRFINYPGGEWIVINSDGYYNASPGGDRYLNVRVDNAVYGIEQFRFLFYKPNIVSLGLKNDRGAYTAAIRNGGVQNAASFIPPDISLRQSIAGRGITLETPPPTDSREFTLAVEIADKNRPLSSIKIFLNGRRLGDEELQKIQGARGLRVAQAALSSASKTVSFTVNLNLDPGSNIIEVSASNGYAEARKSIRAVFEAAEQARDALPELWIMAVGINNYNNSAIADLNYCVNDALEIIESFKRQEGRRFSKVNTLLIADGESVTPTAENIKNNLKFLNNASSRDMALLFFAGHGVSDSEGNFFFLPSDASFGRDGSVDAAKTIRSADMYTALNSGGNRLIFIDACHSGGFGGNTVGVDTNALVRSLMESNAFIFTSSKNNELSQERTEYKHGVFTFSILNGLSGKGLQEERLSVLRLGSLVSREVETITGGRQHPSFYALGSVDFELAHIK